MLKNNKLTDLYVRGKVVVLEDGDEEVKVWMQKLNATEHEAVLRHANAARAKHLSMVNEPDSDIFNSVKNEMLELDKDTLIDVILAPEIAAKQPAVESEMSEKEEWETDGYLQGLRDAWIDGGLADKYAIDKDEEAVRVYNELERFAQQVSKELEAIEADLRADHLARTLDALVDDATKSRITAAANMEWLKAYRRGEVVYATRDFEDRKEKLLDWETVTQLQDAVYGRLLQEYADIRVDPIEGKD